MRNSIRMIMLLTIIPIAGSASGQDFFAGNIQSALNTSSVTSLNITRGDVVDEELRSRSGGGRRIDYAHVVSPAAGAFRPAPDITARVNGRFIEIMSRGQTGKRSELAAFVNRGGLARKFEGLMASYSFDPRNLADVVAAHYIVLWEVVHDQVPTPGEIRGTRGRIVSGMTRKPELARMSNAQKQEAADTLKLLSALALTSYEDFKRRGDRRGLESFQTIVGNWTLRQGIDLARLTITTNGFGRQ